MAQLTKLFSDQCAALCCDVVGAAIDRHASVLMFSELHFIDARFEAAMLFIASEGPDIQVFERVGCPVQEAHERCCPDVFQALAAQVQGGHVRGKHLLGPVEVPHFTQAGTIVQRAGYYSPILARQTVVAEVVQLS